MHRCCKCCTCCVQTYTSSLPTPSPCSICPRPFWLLWSHLLTTSWCCDCSEKCQAVISMIAQKLGNEDAALYRFTHPVKPDQPLVPAPKPALSDTVVERNPSQKASQHPSQLPPSHDALPQAGALQLPLQRPQNEVKGGVGSASHPPRKGSKAAPQYAAGHAKNPIMLAEIKVGAAVCHSRQALCRTACSLS